MDILLQIALLMGMIATVRAGLPHAPPLFQAGQGPGSPVGPPLGPPVPHPALLNQNKPFHQDADYGYRYAVNDLQGNEHSHQQQRVGNAVTGQYKVLLPDGRLQTVTYIADENGYRAKVEYSPARPGEATTAGIGPGAPPAGLHSAGSNPSPGLTINPDGNRPINRPIPLSFRNGQPAAVSPDGPSPSHRDQKRLVNPNPTYYRRGSSVSYGNRKQPTVSINGDIVTLHGTPIEP